MRIRKKSKKKKVSQSLATRLRVPEVLAGEENEVSLKLHDILPSESVALKACVAKKFAIKKLTPILNSEGKHKPGRK